MNSSDHNIVKFLAVTTLTECCKHSLLSRYSSSFNWASIPLIQGNPCNCFPYKCARRRNTQTEYLRLQLKCSQAAGHGTTPPTSFGILIGFTPSKWLRTFQPALAFPHGSRNSCLCQRALWTTLTSQLQARKYIQPVVRQWSEIDHTMYIKCRHTHTNTTHTTHT